MTYGTPGRLSPGVSAFRASWTSGWIADDAGIHRNRPPTMEPDPMTTHALAATAPDARPSLRLVQGGAGHTGRSWWERRAFMRGIVGGCPDHWWAPTARRTAACTCDRFGA